MNTIRPLLLLLAFGLIVWGCDFGFGKSDSRPESDVAVPSPVAGSTFAATSGLAEDRIYAVASCPNGNVWFGFGQQAGGLIRYDGSNLKTFTKEDGLESNRVYALACDRENGIWIGYGIQ